MTQLQNTTPSFVAFVMLLLVITPRSSTGQEKPSPDSSFTHLVTNLPKWIEAASLPPASMNDKQSDASDPVYGQSKVRVARLVSPTTAKITISLVLPGKGPKSEYEYGTVSLFLNWHDGRWTVTRYDESTWFTGKIQRDYLLKLIALIDKVAGK